MVLKRKNKVYDTKRFGHPELRLYHKKGTKLKSPRYLVKCGCCENKIKIYYDLPAGVTGKGKSLEIGGVNGAIDDWKEILLPLLGVKK